MNETARLNHHDKHTLQRIFQHPVTHYLEWPAVVALVGHLGSAEERENGHYVFEINSVSESFHHSQEKKLSDVQGVLEVRRFLEHAGIGPDTTEVSQKTESAAVRLLAVVSHQETQIFETEGKGYEIERLHPYDPHGFRHQVRNKAGNAGGRSSEDPTYYHDMAKTLEGADEVLLMGDATGSSSALNHLTEFLAQHYPLISKKVVGIVPGNIEAMTEPEYLAAAREYCEANHLVS
jgi:hypothetical protein